jgi:hypothetical protein
MNPALFIKLDHFVNVGTFFIALKWPRLKKCAIIYSKISFWELFSQLLESAVVFSTLRVYLIFVGTAETYSSGAPLRHIFLPLSTFIRPG